MIFHWMAKIEKPKIEAEGRQLDGILGEGAASPPPSPPARGSGSAVSSPSGVRGGAPNAQSFPAIFSSQDDLSRHYNVVNCGYIQCSRIRILCFFSDFKKT